MGTFFKILFLTTVLALGFMGCEESKAVLGEEKGGMILPGTKDTTITVDTIITTTIIETKDTLVIRDSVYKLDTIQIVKIDSTIIVDTITTINYDTLHTIDTIFLDDGSSIDTLYILDTTAHVVDTVHITPPIKMVFFVSVRLKYDTSSIEIICRNFSSEIPTMLDSEEQFVLNESGEAVFRTELDSLQHTVPYEYAIVVKEDTLRGVIDTPSQYYLKSLTVNNVAYKYEDVADSNGSWSIPLDFPTDAPLTMSWDADTNSSYVRTFTGSSSKYGWLRDWWGYTDDISLESVGNSAQFDLNDPLARKISGSIRLDIPDSDDVKPDAESKRMEAYHMIYYPSLNYSIERPVQSVNAMKHLYSMSGLDMDSLNNAVTHAYYRDSIQELYVWKEHDGFGAFRGEFSNYRTQSSLRRLKHLFIRYSVTDVSDSLLFGLTSGVTDTTDLSKWDGFGVTLKAGAAAVGDTVVEVIELSDFTNSSGVSLVDPVAAGVLETMDGYMITQQGDDSADNSFYITIDEIFFVGDTGIVSDIKYGIE